MPTQDTDAKQFTAQEEPFTYWAIRDAFIQALKHKDDETLKELIQTYPQMAAKLEREAQNAANERTK